MASSAGNPQSSEPDRADRRSQTPPEISARTGCPRLRESASPFYHAEGQEHRSFGVGRVVLNHDRGLDTIDDLTGKNTVLRDLIVAVCRDPNLAGTDEIDDPAKRLAHLLVASVTSNLSRANSMYTELDNTAWPGQDNQPGPVCRSL